jgi:hypothetical protein
VDLLNLSVDPLNLNEDVSSSCADQIFKFFTPLISTKATIEEKDELKAMILKLCQEAFELRMMMRRSKEGYRCEAPTPEKATRLVDWEDFAEPHYVENGKQNEASDEIAYCLFGPLIKNPEYGIEGRKVLERAHVVMKRR